MAMAGGVKAESLAAYMQGRLSLQDFEWPQYLRPSLPFNAHCNSHLIPEIDLQALLSSDARPPSAGAGAGATHGVDEAGAGCGSGEYAIAASCNTQLALLLEAATSCGFFQVHNHSIPISALQTLQSYARRFFSMPVEYKLEAAKLLGSLVAGFDFHSGYMGGSPVDSPNKCVCEALRVASSEKTKIAAVAQCLWPDEADQQAFGDALEVCSKGFMELSEQLTLTLLRELDMDAEQVLTDYVRGELTAGVKLNHYPAWPQPDKTLGLPVHTDVCLLTVLWQDDVGGLQVQRDGQWINVKPRREALVVNIGDILQVWSNDKFKSGVHQAVLNNIQSRYSIGFFYNPRGDSMLEPLPQLLKKTGEHPKFKSIQISKYRRYVFARVFQDEWQGVDYLRCENKNTSELHNYVA